MHKEKYLLSNKEELCDFQREYYFQLSSQFHLILKIVRKHFSKTLKFLRFLRFFGFSDERRREFILFARLALGCVRDTIGRLEKLSKLKQKADQYKNELKTNPKINFSKLKN